MRVLAKSAGITDAQIAAAQESALIPPLATTPDGAWAVIRAKDVPLFLVQSGQGEAGHRLMHFIVLSVDILRGLAGNLTLLRTLVDAELPVYDRLGDALQPLALADVDASGTDVQVDSILDLMTFCGNQMKTLQALLSALVQGLKIVAQNAPEELNRRARFVEGLLALLPPSTRFGVTFATHTSQAESVDVQIRFSEDDVPDGAIIYDWQSQTIVGDVPDNEYSRFIISQLRLDAELVIQQTTALTAVAGWRFRSGDRLVEALAYASHRRKLDDAVLNNLPVEVEDVSRVLSQDPTLSEEMKVTYARHLITFSLALDDMQYADPVSLLLHNDAQLSEHVRQQMGDALKEGKADIVFATLLRWMANPLGPQGTAWVNLTHSAALAYLDELVADRDFEFIHDFLNQIQNVGPGAAIGRVVRPVIEKIIPLLGQDGTLASPLVTLGAQHLDAEALRQMMQIRDFAKNLPRPVQAYLALLAGRDLKADGVLMQAASAFTPAATPMIMLRFAAMARAAGRFDLIESTAIEGLREAAKTPQGQSERDLLLEVVQKYDDAALKALQIPGPRALLQILLTLGEYQELAYQMIRHSRELYPGDLQNRYLLMVHHLFSQTPIAPEDMQPMLNTLQAANIKGVPFTVACIGTLEGSGWSKEGEGIATSVVATLTEHQEYLDVIPPDAMFSLLKYYRHNEEITSAIRVAGLIPLVAARQEGDGRKTISEMFKFMDWNDQTRVAALELLRRYVRVADEKAAREAVIAFGKELGADVRNKLETSFTINLMMGGVQLEDFVGFIQDVANVLEDTAAPFAGKADLTSGDMMTALSEMDGSLTRDEANELAKEILGLGKAVVVLGKHYRESRPRSEGKYIEALLVGKTNPRSALDVLRVMAGYYARGKRVPLNLQPSGTKLFKGRTVHEFKEEVGVANDLLRSMIQAFPPNKPVKMTAQDVRDEVESMTSYVSTDDQRKFGRTLAVDLQRVVELVTVIEAQGDAKAMDQDSTLGKRIEQNKQRPKSALEFYRFLYAYFRAQS